MNPLLLLKGDSLGKTIYNYVAALAVAGILAWVGFGLVTGKFWKWQAHRQEARADRAEQAASTATANAASANAGAVNAAQTRDAIDKGTLDIRVTVDQTAGRLEQYESVDADPSGALPADIMRDVEASRNRARAAADRLQRTRPR